MRSVKPSTKASITWAALLITGTGANVFSGNGVLGGFLVILGLGFMGVSWICEAIERGQE